MALVESENFAIYSNIEFLYLIGKFAAQSKQCSGEGLTSLNDYLLILDFIKDNFKEKEYYKKRGLAHYQTGMILYNEKDYESAMRYLLISVPALRDHN